MKEKPQPKPKEKPRETEYQDVYENGRVVFKRPIIRKKRKHER
jgi:hypothetical protein